MFVVKLDCAPFGVHKHQALYVPLVADRKGASCHIFSSLPSLPCFIFLPWKLKKVIKASASDSSFASSLSKFPFPLLNLLQALVPSAQKPLFFRGAKNLSCWSLWMCTCAYFDVSSKWRMRCHLFNCSVILSIHLGAKQPFIFLQLSKNLAVLHTSTSLSHHPGINMDMLLSRAQRREPSSSLAAKSD